MRQGDPQPRRWRLAFLSDFEVGLCLSRADVVPEAVSRGVVAFLRSRNPDVPADAEFVFVNYSNRRYGWEVILSHPSWPEVPQGDQIPELEQASPASSPGVM